MPPTQPGHYDDPWPCRIKADFNPLTYTDQRLAVRKGEEGVVWAWVGQQCQVDIDRASPRRIGWVRISSYTSFHADPRMEMLTLKLSTGSRGICTVRQCHSQPSYQCQQYSSYASSSPINISQSWQ